MPRVLDVRVAGERPSLERAAEGCDDETCGDEPHRVAPARRHRRAGREQQCDQARRHEHGWDERPGREPRGDRDERPVEAAVESAGRRSRRRSRRARAERLTRGRSSRSGCAPARRAISSPTTANSRDADAMISACRSIDSRPSGSTSPCRSPTIPSAAQTGARTATAPKNVQASALMTASPVRSQTDAWAGCIVSATTPRRSSLERVEVDLLAQPRPEALERALGVVAAAVEAAVDEALHA